MNRKLLHIAQVVCREFGVWKRPCRGWAVPSRRNACGKNRVALKWGRFQICHCEGALRPWQSREGTDDSERLSSKWHAPPFRVIPRSEASLALPLGELSPKVTERVCRAGPMCPARLSAISLPCHCEPTAGWRGNPHPPPQPAEGSVPYRALR